MQSMTFVEAEELMWNNGFRPFSFKHANGLRVTVRPNNMYGDGPYVKFSYPIV